MTEPRTRAELIAEFFARRPITAAAPPIPPAPSGGKPPEGEPYKPAPYDAKPDETVKCPSCSKMNDADASFCDQCGFKLAGDTNVEVTAPVAEPPKPAVPPAKAPPAAATAKLAGPVVPIDAPLPQQEGGTNAGASGDVDPAALCKDCGHLAASHADTAEGANTGACAMNGCACASTVVPDGENLDGPPDNPGQTPSGQLSAGRVTTTVIRPDGTIEHRSAFEDIADALPGIDLQIGRAHV